jgi:glyoxylase-like metal-dependent hydrolase (beta-lactamase superfamily II)
VHAALQLAGSLPQHLWVSHNHSDHAGELPVVLAVEAAAGRRKTVLAEAAVLDTLLAHRLHELASTGVLRVCLCVWRGGVL